jgi:predicted cation transporter
MTILGLTVILFTVLAAPFLSKRVEENLEPFLLIMGVAATSISQVWSVHLVRESLVEPVKITLAVLAAGVLFRAVRDHLGQVIKAIIRGTSLRFFVFSLVFVLGFLSSAITAIIASLILVEIISHLKLDAASETNLVIISCYSIGLGAALTPIGEPVSTIVIAKLKDAPHQAGFFFLVHLLGIWVIVGILVLSLLAIYFHGHRIHGRERTLKEDRPENLTDVIIRAGKVYLFVMALVLLGTGFTPIVDVYFVHIPRAAIYWINTISAVVDNATLAAAEVSPQMSQAYIRFLLMGLLISGGMLIPGNIPNIIAAGKLKISSRAWARLGIPLGAVLMLVYFFSLILLL